jgi:integrase
VEEGNGPKNLTTQQLAKFITAAEGDPYHDLALFMSHTGVRLGEALALRWEDIELDSKHARIRRSVRASHESQTKSRFGMRSIDLSSQAVKMLSELPSRAEGGLVFPGKAGDRIQARHIHYAFRRISKRAGLPPVHPDMLRDTWATRMINQGAPLNYVSRALGHHSTAFTMTLYATSVPESRNDNVDALSARVAATPALIGLDMKGARPAVPGELETTSGSQSRDEERP